MLKKLFVAAVLVQVVVAVAPSENKAGAAGAGLRAVPFHGVSRNTHFTFLPGLGFLPGAPGIPGRPCAVASVVRCSQNTGSVTAAYPDDEDDIDKMHFRVQEPFGPWDIGPKPEMAGP
jgi:hypothetical protein